MLLIPCAILLLLAPSSPSLPLLGDPPTPTPSQQPPPGQLPHRGKGGGIARIPTFDWKAATLTAGDVITTLSTSHSLLRTRITADGSLVQEFDQLEDKSGDKTITILAVDARGPTRFRVEYRGVRFLQQRSDEAAIDKEVGETAEHNPLANRAFVLERDGDTFRVLGAAGTPVEKSLALLVLEEECIHDGQIRRAGDLFARELAGKKIDPGDEVEISREVARAFVDGQEGLDAVSMKVVLKPEITPEGRMVAAFDVRLEIRDTGTGGNGSTKVELVGEVRVDVSTGRYLTSALAGNLTLSQITADSARAVEIVGSGPWKIAETVTYGRVP